MKTKIIKKSFSCLREGLTIRGKIFITKQKELKNEPLPAVILSHGFLANQKMCFNYAKILAELGYICFTFDFCGGGIKCSSDGNTYDMSVLTEKKDLYSVIDFVSNHKAVQKEHISLLGCSQGGFVSGIVAKELKSKIEKLLMFYPALCIPDDARNGKMIMIRFDPHNVPDIILKFPMKVGKAFALDTMNMDFMTELKGYNGKVFLIHGTADKIVNIEYSRKAKTLYTDITYNEIKDGEHGFRKNHAKEADELLRLFMQQ